GGATTLGAGSVSFGIALDSRSGAETGGATISLTLATGTFADPKSRCTSRDGGATALAVREAASRIRSRLIEGVGATTPVFRAGAARSLGRPRSGVGATAFIWGSVGKGVDR